MESWTYNMDCMAAMAVFPNKFFDLAVVDPPYGGGGAPERGGLRGGGAEWADRRRSRFGGVFDKYHIGGSRDLGPVFQVRDNAETDRGYL